MQMRLKISITLCATLLLLGACSDNDGSMSVDAGPGTEQEPVFGDDSLSISALNYETRLSSALAMLRLDGVNTLLTAVDDIVVNGFGPLFETETGTRVIDCPGGGTASRLVSAAPVFDNAREPILIVRSSISFESCNVDLGQLDGALSYEWERSSPASRSAAQWVTVYGLSDTAFTHDDESVAVTGSISKRVTVSGTSERYLYSAEVSDYTRSYLGNTESASNVVYEQSFSHSILQDGAPDGVVHQFSESGAADIDLALGALAEGPFVGQIRIDPAVVYANGDESGVLSHRGDAWAEGVLLMTSGDGSALRVLSRSQDATLIYQLTDSDGNETVIEREWIAPAECLGEEEFRFGLCL